MKYDNTKRKSEKSYRDIETQYNKVTDLVKVKDDYYSINYVRGVYKYEIEFESLTSAKTYNIDFNNFPPTYIANIKVTPILKTDEAYLGEPYSSEAVLTITNFEYNFKESISTGDNIKDTLKIYIDASYDWDSGAGTISLPLYFKFIITINTERVYNEVRANKV